MIKNINTTLIDDNINTIDINTYDTTRASFLSSTRGIRGFEERLGAVLGPICGHHKSTFSWLSAEILLSGLQTFLKTLLKVKRSYCAFIWNYLAIY